MKQCNMCCNTSCWVISISKETQLKALTTYKVHGSSGRDMSFLQSSIRSTLNDGGSSVRDTSFLQSFKLSSLSIRRFFMYVGKLATLLPLRSNTSIVEKLLIDVNENLLRDEQPSSMRNLRYSQRRLSLSITLQLDKSNFVISSYHWNFLERWTIIQSHCTTMFSPRRIKILLLILNKSLSSQDLLTFVPLIL